jgi:hypothetical protein
LPRREIGIAERVLREQPALSSPSAHPTVRPALERGREQRLSRQAPAGWWRGEHRLVSPVMALGRPVGARR